MAKRRELSEAGQVALDNKTMAWFDKLSIRDAAISMARASDLNRDLPRISTGNFMLDVATYGGIPQGRVVRFYGKPKGGKTGSCLNTAATYQKNHCGNCFKRTCKCTSRPVPWVLWIDAENRLSDMMGWVEAHGIDLSRFRVMNPPHGQALVDVVDATIRNAEHAMCGLIIVDSLAHVVSEDELNKMTTDGVTVGRNAHLLNSAWRRWVSAANSLGIRAQSKPTVLCINQLRMKVGVMVGSPDTQPGGLGQEYVSSIDVFFKSGPDTYVLKNKEGVWIAKQKSFKSTFKPPKDSTPDLVQIDFRVTQSGICPRGRSGQFNYWLKNAHSHRSGDPDNGLQLWEYAKRYMLEGKSVAGLKANTLGELETLFRADSDVQQTVWSTLMPKLIASDFTAMDETSMAGAEDGGDEGAADE